MQVEQRRDGSEAADGESSLACGRRSADAMREPVKELRKAGDNDNDDYITETARTQAERFLLHAGVDPGSERDIRDLNQDNREPAARAASGHGSEIHQRASSCAEKSALPVPAGEYPHHQ